MLPQNLRLYEKTGLEVAQGAQRERVGQRAVHGHWRAAGVEAGVSRFDPSSPQATVQ